MERITSRQNETLKRHAKLLSSAAKRREEGMFLCEGARLCEDAARSGVEIAVCYVTDKAYEKYGAYCDRIFAKAEQSFWIADHAAALLSDTKNPQGVYCVCRMPKERQTVQSLDPGGKYLALENMQDPSNLGTVLRTAEALGVSGVLLSEGCCDAYSPKVLRGSMGAVFRMPMVHCGAMPQAVAAWNQLGFSTMAAVVTEAEPVVQTDFSQPSIMVIGNEGNGLTEETVAACTKRVTIPMLGRAESLNASAATAILLWEMMRGGVLHG